jgi:rare lipoprotein A (peptidoglycan hydrolase)
VRTRLIVAFAAIMAASALVAVPEPVTSRPPSAALTIDRAQLSAVSIALTDDPATSTTPTTDIATRSAGRLERHSAFPEPAAAAPDVLRPTVRQPTTKAGSIAKNYWRFDGNISWYGPGFFGSGTACGQKYTREIMGVAHRTLPCGTLVTFRNTANGRQVTVPVIDRGPYVSFRQWDMSYGMCTYLDHCYTGTIEWRWGTHGGG